MSYKHPVDCIEDATRAYDVNTGVDVMIEEQLTDRFWICRDPDDKYIICAVDELEDFHYM